MKVALVGNQNSGKTTLFNLLTGMNAKIGNWPGVTIEKKEGKIKKTKHKVIDLPGIYSLSPYSTEEEIARKYIFKEEPDVIINIVDASSLERSLYLTTQLLELDTRVIVALNMADILEKKGIVIDIDELKESLGVEVCLISALKETVIDELIKKIDEEKVYKKIKIFDDKIERKITFILENLHVKNSRFIAVNLLEEDPRFKEYQNSKIKDMIKDLEKNYDTDLEEVIATKRYKFIEKVKARSFRKIKVKEGISEKLDKIFLNKWISLPIFIVIMFLVYYLSVGVVGSRTVELVGSFMDYLSNMTRSFLHSINASDILISLIVDGIIAGVSAVIGFVPQLIILFLCICLLETTGYMSRIAFLLDKIFRKIGLSGKSLIPFIVGSGCSVPGIMGTRIIENEDERKMTAILTPFIPCSAKLPIIALFSGYFFKENSGLVSASLYFFAIIVIIISALFLSKFVFLNTSDSFISELPAYKVPSFKYILKDVFDKVVAFIQRAGSIILFCSIIIWFLLSFSLDLKYGIDIKDSILAAIGKSIAWIFYPILGEVNWGASVSAIQGLVAKEQVVSSMSVIAGFSDKVSEGSKIFGGASIFSTFTASSAYAFMVFNLFSAPCFGALGAMRRELGSLKSLFKAMAFQTGFAWLLASLVYQVGSRIEAGIINVSDIIIVLLLVLILLFIISKRGKKKDCSSCPYCKSCEEKLHESI